jgi:hypothetical protein
MGYEPDASIDSGARPDANGELNRGSISDSSEMGIETTVFVLNAEALFSDGLFSVARSALV